MSINPIATEAPVADDFPSLSFQVDQDICAITARCVSSIILMPDEVVHFPEAPGYCLGVIQLRGQVIPLMDMRTLFGLYPRDPGFGEDSGPQSLVIVIENETTQMGLAVDAVHSVETIVPIDHSHSDSFFAQSQYVTGVGRSEKTGESLLILNHAALLALCEGLSF